MLIDYIMNHIKSQVYSSFIKQCVTSFHVDLKYLDFCAILGEKRSGTNCSTHKKLMEDNIWFYL